MPTRLLLLGALVAASPAAGPSGAAPPPDSVSAFPADALLPKKETGADRFLQEFPAYDGRGVIVAVFDTGVDPGAPGLQVTTDGRPKIVDVVDASGSGDVDTSTKRRAAEDGTIEGISGRRLRPAGAWKNPSGDWRVGQKPAWEIFPSGLVTRMKRERRRGFDRAQRAAVARAKSAVDHWNEEHPSPGAELLEDREDLVARVEQLEEMAEGREDPGPVFDCIVFHDGRKWRAAVDTDEDGAFDDEKTLTNFRDEGEWATFGERDLLNYALNVYEDGDRLSIVADAGAHGTHVAGIVAAHYPDRPEMNGIAPGAQIVSIKIGDTRLGSTSVGTGDVRGYVASLADGVDLVNMSYGGATRLPDRGRLEDLRSEFVNEHGVIFVSTAGNSGPALSSVGGPGGTTTATLGIGAVVSPAMMEAQYSLRESYAEQPYNWSSRGPAADGYLGVDFCAPGGAISPVPNWSLKGNALMNGTSMAAPSVAGGIALLLSGLKQQGIAYSPHSVRRALANTAQFLGGAQPFEQGTGVVRIDEAWKHLVEYGGRDDRPVRYRFAIADRDSARGIYLRDPFENDRPLEVRVTVAPTFPRDWDNEPKVEFEKRVRLRATAPWIDVGESVLLMHGGRGFNVRVDPTGLSPGVHYGEVRGTDTAAPGYGPLFRIPVTVTRTVRVDAAGDWTHRERVPLGPGTVTRRFLAVPDGATWADIRMRREGAGTERTFILHTVQLLSDQAYADHELKAYIGFVEGEEEVRSTEVTGGRTLEVALAQNWSSLGESEVDLEVGFHGLLPSDAEIVIPEAVPAVPVDVRAPFRLESLEPSGKLTWLRKTLVPGKAEVRALSEERDGLWDGRRVYELVCEYEIDTEKGAYTFRPPFGLLPYAEDSFESTLWLVLDDKGRRVGAGAGAESRTVDLEKGKHRVLLHVRHEDPDLLEETGRAALFADRRLKKPAPLGMHAAAEGAAGAPSPFGSRDLLPGETARVWISPPGPDDWPDGAAAGDELLGVVELGGKRDGQAGAGKRPGGWPVRVVLPARAPEEAEETEAEETEDGPPELERLAEEVRDLQIAALARLRGEESGDAFDDLAGRILSAWPGYLPVLVARLERLDDEDGEGDPRAVVHAADEIVRAVDQQELAEHFGTSFDEDDPAAKEKRHESEQERDALREALFRKARALVAVVAEDPDNEPLREELDKAWKDLEKWADVDAAKYVAVRADREDLRGRPGVALAILNAGMKDAEDEQHLRERRLELFEELGWTHWARSERRALLLLFPGTKLVF